MDENAYCMVILECRTNQKLRNTRPFSAHEYTDGHCARHKGSNGSYHYNRRVPVSRIEGFLFPRIERLLFLESNGSYFYWDRTVSVSRIERFLFLGSNGSCFKDPMVPVFFLLIWFWSSKTRKRLS